MGLLSWLRLWIIAAGVTAASSLWAHHSLAGVFDTDDKFSITGVITDVEWINPHIYLHLEVTDDDGSIVTWRLETHPVAFMRKAGINKTMLMGDGEPVTISGIAGRATPNLGYIYRITYADGHFYQLYSDRQG